VQKVTKDEAWAFAIGLAQIDGGKVSDEMLKLIEREKRGGDNQRGHTQIS